MAETILKNAASIVLSLFVALFLLAAIEWIGAILYPFPADFAGTREEIEQQVANYPPLILALLGGVGWGLTMFVACHLATRLSTGRQPVYGIGLGLILLAGAFFNMGSLPYPLWYWVLELIVLPLGIYFGVRTGSGPTAQNPQT